MLLNFPFYFCIIEKEKALYYSNETISYHPQRKLILSNEIEIIASSFTLSPTKLF